MGIKSIADIFIILFFICFILYGIGILINNTPMIMISGIGMALFAMALIISSKR